MSSVFETEVDEIVLVETDGVQALVQVINISAPDPEAEDLAPIYETLNDQGAVTLAGDIFELFGLAVQNKHGLSLDQTAINAVHQGFAGGGHY